MKIENIVCSGSLNCQLDLKDLSNKCPSVQYGVKRYPGAYLTVDGYKTTLYRTGKYIMQGLKSFDEIEPEFQRICGVLSEYVELSSPELPSIRNMVCSSDYGRELDLHLVYSELLITDYDVQYEPECFPGMILRIEGITFNVFQSGRFIILGCTSKVCAIQAEKRILTLFSAIGA